MNTTFGIIVMFLLVLVAALVAIVSIAAPVVALVLVIKLIDKHNKQENLRKYSGRYPYGDEKEESDGETGE